MNSRIRRRVTGESLWMARSSGGSGSGGRYRGGFLTTGSA